MYQLTAMRITALTQGFAKSSHPHIAINIDIK